jgi:DNA-directed RNA polymerase specialized sigma24 family protein
MSAHMAKDASTLTAALEESFVSHRAAAEALARRILGEATLAEDAVQIAFTQILVRLRGGDRSLLMSNPRAVVLHGTRWAALKLAERDRDRHAAVPLCDALPGVQDGALDQAESRILSAGIVAALPPHYGDVLVLRYLEDQPDERAAARLALTVKAYRRRLDRARAAARMVARRDGLPALAPALHLRGRHCRVDARVRQIRARLAHLLGGPGCTHWAMFAAIGSLAVGAFAPGLTVPQGRQGSQATMALADERAAAGQVASPQAAVLASPHPVSDGAVRSVQAPGPSPAPGASGLALLNPPPPEATTIVGVAPSPQYQRTHTLVAEGWVLNNCTGNCYFAYQSTDGGATWKGWPMPVATTFSLALPPDYPDDPRVLVTTGFNNPPCLMASLAAMACTPLPLTGAAAFAARFDDGNPVIYGMAGSTLTLVQGFVAYNLQTHLARPIIPNLSGQSMQVVTPSTDTGPDVYLSYYGEDPRDGFVAGTVRTEPPRYYIEACTADLNCSVTSVGGIGGLALRTDSEDSGGGVLAGTTPPADPAGASAALTLDQGRTYPVRVPLPFGKQTGQWDWAVMGPTSRASLYLETQVDSDPETFTRYGADGSVEPLPLPISAVSTLTLTDFIHVMPLTSRRFIAFDINSQHLGFWCSVDGGHHWLSRCPADG